MSTFIGQLIGFAVIVFILMKWVVPPVRDMMHKQQDAVRTAARRERRGGEEARRRRRDARQGARGCQGPIGEGDRRGTTGFRANRRAAAGAGGCRCRTNQGSGCTAGSVDAPAAHPSASAAASVKESVQKAADLVRDSRRRSGRAGGHRRPLPRRSRRDGAVERWRSRPAHRPGCVPPAAQALAALVEEFDNVAGGSRTRTHHARRRTGLGGHAARRPSRA